MPDPMRSYLDFEKPVAELESKIDELRTLAASGSDIGDEVARIEDKAAQALTDALLVERVRENTRADTEARLRGDLIEELLAGEMVSRESLVRRARLLGADLSEGAVAVVGSLNENIDILQKDA